MTLISDQSANALGHPFSAIYPLSFPLPSAHVFGSQSSISPAVRHDPAIKYIEYRSDFPLQQTHLSMPQTMPANFISQQAPLSIPQQTQVSVATYSPDSTPDEFGAQGYLSISEPSLISAHSSDATGDSNSQYDEAELHLIPADLRKELESPTVPPSVTQAEILRLISPDLLDHMDCPLLAIDENSIIPPAYDSTASISSGNYLEDGSWPAYLGGRPWS
nr:uncharacterized protein CI109_005884 [Kwoniella shandongensis]KAA5525721.1 hypothetical protein CI109_005884 [Kwoniella shandongensis]